MDLDRRTGLTQSPQDLERILAIEVLLDDRSIVLVAMDPKRVSTGHDFDSRLDTDHRVTTDAAPLLHRFEQEARRGSIVGGDQPPIRQHGGELIGEDSPYALDGAGTAGVGGFSGLVGHVCNPKEHGVGESTRDRCRATLIALIPP